MSCKHNGYWRDVGTIDAYYHANMDRLHINALSVSWPLLGNSQYSAVGRPGPVYSDRIVDSLISPLLSLAHRAHVFHSVISAGVQIGPASVVRDSIVMRDVRIGARVRFNGVIIDEGASIADDVELGLDHESDKRYGVASSNGVLVVPAGARVGNGPAPYRTPELEYQFCATGSG